MIVVNLVTHMFLQVTNEHTYVVGLMFGKNDILVLMCEEISSKHLYYNHKCAIFSKYLLNLSCGHYSNEPNTQKFNLLSLSHFFSFLMRKGKNNKNGIIIKWTKKARFVPSPCLGECLEKKRENWNVK